MTQSGHESATGLEKSVTCSNGKLVIAEESPRLNISTGYPHARIVTHMVLVDALKPIIPEGLRRFLWLFTRVVMKRFGPSLGPRILPVFREGPVPTLVNITTQLCSASQFDEPHYRELLSMIGHPFVLHRKAWEQAYIVEALLSSGLVVPGAKGLSFGCGLEPMPAFFVSRGCKIVATDMPMDQASLLHWKNSGQHASDKQFLQRPDLCDVETFILGADFRFVDMNHIPDNLTGFDFLWSSCALEHLGSLRHGLDFMKRAMRCLRPGGVAVHTTELNISSLDQTFESKNIVLYRKKDIETFIDECRAEEISVAPPNWRCVSTELDLLVDRHPYGSDRHLKIYESGFVCTSIGIILTANKHLT